MREKSLTNANNSRPVKIRGGETKVMKKLLSSFLVFALVLTMLVPAFASAAETTNDVAGTVYEDAVSRLKALEVLSGYPDGTFKPDNSITRAEFAVAAVRLLGLEDAAKVATGTNKFSDMAGYGWANGYVNIALQQGIVSGYPDGTFKPGNNVTYAEALSILVRALGYNPSVTGEWPSNYVVKATQIGLTEDVEGIVANAAAPRGVIALFADNALTVKMMEEKQWFGTGVTYEVGTKTILEDRLGVKAVTGVVVANEYVDFASATAEEGEVVVDVAGVEKVYNVATSDIASLLGFKVKLYAKNSDVIFAEVSGNTVLTVEAADIDTAATTDTSFAYTDANGKDKTADITNADIVFNGRDGGANTLDALLPTSGAVVLVNNDSDSAYDFAYVVYNDTYVVDEVLAEDEYVAAKGGLDLDLSDEDAIYSIVKDGEEVALEDLNEWDVLEVNASLDGLYFEITVVDNAVVGEIEEVLSATKVVINGKTLRVAGDELTGLTFDNSAVGAEGTFYLDIDGKVVAFNEKAAEKATNYAYVVDAQDATVGLNTNAQFQLLIANGDVVVYNGATKVTVDGKRYNEVDAPVSKGDFVKYELDTNGELKLVEVLNAETAPATLYFDKDTNQLVDSLIAPPTVKFVVTKDTLVFFTDGDDTDGDDTGVYGLADLKDGGQYSVQLFEATSTKKVPVLLITDTQFTAATTQDVVFIVEKVSVAKDSDGDTVDKLYGFEDGAKVVKYANDLNVVSATMGDIILVQYNGNGQVSLQHTATTVTGTVYAKALDVITVGASDTSDVAYTLADDVQVYVHDTAAGTITLSTLASVKAYEDTHRYASDVTLHQNADGLVDVIVVTK